MDLSQDWCTPADRVYAGAWLTYGSSVTRRGLEAASKAITAGGGSCEALSNLPKTELFSRFEEPTFFYLVSTYSKTRRDETSYLLQVEE